MNDKIIFLLEIDINAEGDKIAYLGKEGARSTYRIAGPKAWGGKRNIALLKINEDDIVIFLKDYAPEIIDRIINEYKNNA